MPEEEEGRDALGMATRAELVRRIDRGDLDIEGLLDIAEARRCRVSPKGSPTWYQEWLALMRDYRRAIVLLSEAHGAPFPLRVEELAGRARALRTLDAVLGDDDLRPWLMGWIAEGMRWAIGQVSADDPVGSLRPPAHVANPGGCVDGVTAMARLHQVLEAVARLADDAAAFRRNLAHRPGETE